MANTIYQGDTGLEILVDCGRDISGASQTALSVRLPSGRVRSWSTSVTDERYLRYVTQAGDLAEPGLYRLQASLVLGNWTGRGKTACFHVTPNFS